MRPYLVALVLLITILGGIGTYIMQRFAALSEQVQAPPPVLVAAEAATTEDWAQYTDSVGTIRSVQGIDVTAETSGEISELHFDSGMVVSAGDLLLVINDAVEQAQRQSILAELDLAERLHKRDVTLLAQKSIPETQFDRSRSELARLRAQLARTEAEIAKKRIVAPFGGVLGIRRVDLGDFIQPGTLITSLQDTSALEVDFNVPSRFATDLKVGLQAELTSDAFPNQRFTAQVTAIDSRVEPATRNLMLRARLDRTDGLIPGMFANVRLYVGSKQALVTVPETAITFSVQGDIVWVVSEENGQLTVQSRVVEVGETRAARTSVLSNLEPGERVVIVGQNKLYRGAVVALDQNFSLNFNQ